jgi:sugar phosphate isomerase/epimerase
VKSTDQKNYSSITANCFINAPFEQLQGGLLKLFLSNSLQPEIGLEGNCLWEVPNDEFRKMADVLRENGLSCTLHAPFYDLAPGGMDTRIREVTREKLRRAFELIAVFQPRSIVCHIGYDEEKHSYKLEQWVEHSTETWRDLLRIAVLTNTPVMFENTYETTPDIHYRLFTEINSPNLRFCLDTGHLMSYAGTSWHPWLDRLRPWLGQIHLHDNDGKRDDHIAIGSGRFDFEELLLFLQSHDLTPLITLEPHSEKDLWLSLEHIEKNRIFMDFFNRTGRQKFKVESL